MLFTFEGYHLLGRELPTFEFIEAVHDPEYWVRRDGPIPEHIAAIGAGRVTVGYSDSPPYCWGSGFVEFRATGLPDVVRVSEKLFPLYFDSEFRKLPESIFHYLLQRSSNPWRKRSGQAFCLKEGPATPVQGSEHLGWIIHPNAPRLRFMASRYGGSDIGLLGSYSDVLPIPGCENFHLSCQCTEGYLPVQYILPAVKKCWSREDRFQEIQPGLQPGIVVFDERPAISKVYPSQVRLHHCLNGNFLSGI